MNKQFHNFQLSIISFVLLCLLSSCGTEGTKENQKVDPPKSPKLELPESTDNKSLGTSSKIFQNDDGSWGYDILINGKVYIHQAEKPAVGGRMGFESEKYATAVAKLVMHKIENGIMPPSVNTGELDSLKNLTIQ